MKKVILLIMDQNFDFFQYPENYDRIMINAALDNLNIRLVGLSINFVAQFSNEFSDPGKGSPLTSILVLPSLLSLI